MKNGLNRTYHVRVVTIFISIALVIISIITIAILVDDSELARIGITFLIFISSIIICTDSYFALMYYYYWKNPELRIDRNGKGPGGLDLNKDQDTESPADNRAPNVQILYVPQRQREEVYQGAPIIIPPGTEYDQEFAQVPTAQQDKGFSNI